MVNNMEETMKKYFAFISIIALTVCAAQAKPKNIHPVSDKSAQEIVLEMKTGWNLGNTLDANACTGLASEESWGQPHTTKEIIDGIAAAGFKTIRIPVSWANHLESKKYKIDPAWMARVKQIVDWAIEDDMYVVLNIHHDKVTKCLPLPYCCF